ncbi:hypothetical protein [Streptomyces sp. NPDC057257]|uniref:hypothetical protein n=1 Tax=Streptomyces sp. NPDC057257 TaxID=3346071 RepID=UPI003645668A
MKVSKYWKAIVAAAVAGLGATGTALSDDRITSGEWWTVAAAVAGALGLTWAVPNKQTTDA